MPPGSPATFAALNAVLDAAARGGAPHAADWPHRAVHVRILERAVGTLDRPLAELDALLPDDVRALPAAVRAAIPGNAPLTAKVLRSRLTRARGLLWPALFPWDAVLALAEPTIPEIRNAWPQIRRAAAETGLATPAEIDSTWIADRLSDVADADETVRRMSYATLVRVSRLPAIQEAGLLRPDLALPPTRYAVERAARLPDWLEAIHAAETDTTRAAIRRVWRTVRHLDLGAKDADELLRLIEEGRLCLAAARAVENITSATWRMYVQRTHKALRVRVPDPSRYATRLRHPDRSPKPPKPRTPKPLARSASCLFAMEAARRLTPPVAPEPEALLTPDTWPRVVAAMKALGRERGYGEDSIESRIDRARQVLGQMSRGPVARLPRTERAAPALKPKPARRRRAPIKVPALPEPLCAEARRLLALRGYTGNAAREMVAVLGRAHSAALASGGLRADPTLRDVADHGARMTGRGQADARRMLDIIALCETPAYAAFLAALRAAGVALRDDPTATLFAATGGARPISALTRDWAWTHEHELRPDKRVTFCRAIERLDALRAIPELAPLLPAEPLGPLPASPRHRGQRHPHARHPLPRRIEAEAEALDLDRDGPDWHDLVAGLHSLYRAAREAQLFAAGDDIDCATLLSSETVARIGAAGTIGARALQTARQRTAPLRPNERRATPRDRWALLLDEIRSRNTVADARLCLTPVYAVRRHALADGIGPEEVTSSWARTALARIGADRIAHSGVRQGLRLLTGLRDDTGIPADLLPEEIDADLLAVRRSVAGR